MATRGSTTDRENTAYLYAGGPVVVGFILGVAGNVLFGGGLAIILIGTGLGVIAGAVVFGRRIWDDPIAGLTPAAADPTEAPTDEDDVVARPD